MRMLRLNLLCVMMLLLVYALFFETHTIQTLNGGATYTIGGRSFLESSTSEEFALHRDSLVARFAPVSGSAVSAKDCKT